MADLTVRGVRKWYGPVRALDGLDLDVPAGALTAVLGPSGCGKTTLLRCVAGFERVDAGEIRVRDRLVAGPRVHTAPERRRVAVVPQEGALFPHLSVAGNVAYGLSRSQRRAGRWKRSWPWSGSPSTATGCRTSFRAGNSSGSRSPGHWRRARRWYCWMSRSAPWTPACARSSGTTSGGVARRRRDRDPGHPRPGGGALRGRPGGGDAPAGSSEWYAGRGLRRPGRRLGGRLRRRSGAALRGGRRPGGPDGAR